METPRISASSYSNTAPLIWSFLYGSQHGQVELILDNAPARSAQLLAESRVDAALVPVIAYHQFDDVKLVADVCVGARERVRSVCLITNGVDLADVRSVALDASSRTSVVLTKIIFREFLGFEPEWRQAEPDLDAMLRTSDCALLIGDPALAISDAGRRLAARERQTPAEGEEIRADDRNATKVFDLAELWKRYTGLGFVFAMWMGRGTRATVDFAAARDEGIRHLEEIVSNYRSEIGIDTTELSRYLSENISYSIDDSMQAGMEMYFKLAGESGLIDRLRPVNYLE